VSLCTLVFKIPLHVEVFFFLGFYSQCTLSPLFFPLSLFFPPLQTGMTHRSFLSPITQFFPFLLYPKPRPFLQFLSRAHHFPFALEPGIFLASAVWNFPKLVLPRNVRVPPPPVLWPVAFFSSARLLGVTHSHQRAKSFQMQKVFAWAEFFPSPLFLGVIN